MSKIKDGGQAFPRAGFSGPRGFGTPENGMSLRDWFAGQALSGLISQGFDVDEVVGAAYATADAMIAARDRSAS